MNDEDKVIRNWLNIALEKRTQEVVELCEENSDECYSELINLLKEIKTRNPELVKITDRIENIFLVKTRVDTEYVYPLAIEEGIEIGKKIR